MKQFKIFLLLLTACGLLMLPGSAIADSITPDSFSAALAVGESVTITKTVTVSEVPPETAPVDVYFLADTTGSMYYEISAVQAAATSILSSISGLGDVNFAVGEYKDFTDSYAYRLNTDVTSSQTSAQNGIDMWAASGGGDWEEAQLFALNQAATGTSWRTVSTRILVWFGDAPGHDPSGGVTQASAIANLNAANISVEAVDVGSLNYYGQAAAIASATGGSYYSGISSSSIVSTISNAIETAVLTYTSVGLDLSEVPVGVTASYDGPITGSFDRSTERTFEFELTFTGDTAGSYNFNTYAIVDGGRVATESDSIRVGGESVPEPATILLLGTGLLGLGVLRRKIK